MLEKSRNAVFFQWFVCRVSRKVGLLKRRVRSHVVRGEIKNCTPLWRKTNLEVKMSKTWRVRSTFRRSDVEKMHAAVARSTFGSENLQNTSFREHFCRKIVRRCGERHIWKWKCTKHLIPRALLEVQMSKNCTPVAKSRFRSENVQNTSFSENFLKFWCRKIARRCGEKQNSKWKSTKHPIPRALFEVLMSKNCTRLWRKAQSKC